MAPGRDGCAVAPASRDGGAVARAVGRDTGGGAAAAGRAGPACAAGDGMTGPPGACGRPGRTGDRSAATPKRFPGPAGDPAPPASRAPGPAGAGAGTGWPEVTATPARWAPAPGCLSLHPHPAIRRAPVVATATATRARRRSPRDDDGAGAPSKGLPAGSETAGPEGTQLPRARLRCGCPASVSSIPTPPAARMRTACRPPKRRGDYKKCLDRYCTSSTHARRHHPSRRSASPMVGASSNDASDWRSTCRSWSATEREIHYDVYGEGYPLLLFAPGGMNSIARLWRERPGSPGERMPWIDPTAELLRRVPGDRHGSAQRGPVDGPGKQPGRMGRLHGRSPRPDGASATRSSSCHGRLYWLVVLPGPVSGGTRSGERSRAAKSHRIERGQPPVVSRDVRLLGDRPGRPPGPR